MTLHSAFETWEKRLRDYIAGTMAGTVTAPETVFGTLALDLFALQFQHVPTYWKFCEGRGATPQTVTDWRAIPAVPTAAFKDWELTSLPPEERTRVFHSSGTTEQRPSRHFHSAASLAVYEASLKPWFQRYVLGDWEDLVEAERVRALDKPGFLMLTPSPEAAPHSSLIHMLGTVREEFGARDSFFGGRVDATGAWTLDLDQVLFGLRKSMCANRPVFIMGTAFTFVHLLDHFEAHNIRYKLAAGSRIMETGGYKGRSRELPKAELHALLTKHLGIPATHIICEYGMSELSSQAYDVRPQTDTTEPVKTPARIFHFPPWARAMVLSPETGREVADGETGLLRLLDLANMRSVQAVQTEDLAVRRGDGFELLGRAQRAEPRGCSLMTQTT